MNGKRIIAVALMAALCLTGITLIPVENVRAGTEITYMDAVVDPETHEVTYTEAVATCIEVKDLEDKTKWGADGETVWYAVTESETIDRRITVSGRVNLILCDHITLNAKRGITTTGATLNIYGQSGGTGTLYAGATEHERFNAPDFCAGIGGDYSAGGTVTINGGNVIACGGESGAGIGGGSGGAGTDFNGSISIFGGVVTAIGGYKSAGIGGGSGGAGTGFNGSISIFGGVVTANGTSDRVMENNENNDKGGAGIGGGWRGAGTDMLGSITVFGGNVTANGDGGGAGIGGGDRGAGTDQDGCITVNGGVVTANGDEGGAGIGGGNGVAGMGGGDGSINISGGEVTATGGRRGAGIGGGDGVAGKEININGGTVTATGGENGGAGIGGGSNGAGGKVYVCGGYVEAYGSDDAEGIGKGKDGSDSGTLELDEGVVCYDADTMTALQPDEAGYIGARTEHMKTVYVPEEPPIFADYTCKVDGKVKIPVGKKVKKVTVEDETIASAKKKGKKVIVTGKAPGTVNVTAYGKKNKVLGNWIVKVE